MSPLQSSVSIVATNSSHLTATVLLTVSSANEILLLDLISTALMNHSANNYGHNTVFVYGNAPLFRQKFYYKNCGASAFLNK